MGGTLLLDEIGDMPPSMQAKLLRLLQEGELERIGGERPIVVNTRVIVATHRDLEALVRNGRRTATTSRRPRALGLERSHFYKKCQQLGIDVKAERSHA